MQNLLQKESTLFLGFSNEPNYMARTFINPSITELKKSFQMYVYQSMKHQNICFKLLITHVLKTLEMNVGPSMNLTILYSYKNCQNPCQFHLLMLHGETSSRHLINILKLG